MGMWMVLVLVDVSGYVDGVGTGGCQWVCGWHWWVSVGVWMVLMSVSGCVDGVDVCQWVWMVLVDVSGCVDGIGECQWVWWCWWTSVVYVLICLYIGARHQVSLV